MDLGKQAIHALSLSKLNENPETPWFSRIIAPVRKLWGYGSYWIEKFVKHQMHLTIKVKGGVLAPCLLYLLVKYVYLNVSVVE